MCNAPGLSRSKAALAEGDLGDGIVIGQHRNDGFALASIGDTGSMFGALCHQGLGFDRCPVVDGQAITGLQQVGRHARSHLSEADKTDVHDGLHVTLNDRGCIAKPPISRG